MTRDDIELRFIELSKLQPDWDGFNSQPPNKNSIDLSKKVIDIIGHENTSYIMGLAYKGGIGISIFKKGIFIDILNDSSGKCFLYGGFDEPHIYGRHKQHLTLEELRTIVYTMLNLRGDS